MSYQASGTIKCWKKYDCLGCGAVFRHKFERAVSGQGGTAEQAEANAQQAGIAALQNQVDTIPCPECGRVQPRMVGHDKNNTHFGLVWAFLTAGVVVLLVGANDVMTRDVSAYATAGIALLALLAHFLTAKTDPNANQDANRARALEKVQSGSVEVIRTGDPSNGEPPPPLTTGGHRVYLALALVAVLAALVPVAMRHLNGWALADADPPVLGPGDTFRISFPDKIDCVKSTWAGTPQLTWDQPLNGAAVFSNNDSWGMSMSVKSSEMHTHPTLWADVKLPPNPDLQDKELSGTITMSVRYPRAEAGDRMSTQTTNVTKTFKVKLVEGERVEFVPHVLVGRVGLQHCAHAAGRVGVRAARGAHEVGLAAGPRRIARHSAGRPAAGRTGPPPRRGPRRGRGAAARAQTVGAVARPAARHARAPGARAARSAARKRRCNEMRSITSACQTPYSTGATGTTCTSTSAATKCPPPIRYNRPQ